MHNPKTILATAYAVNPEKGSEDGMGWNFVYQISRFHRVIAITRENNREAIERYMHNHPDPIYNNITWVYFDLPYWMRFWKRGGRGALLYFWMWQRAMPGFIRKQQLQFDIVHNVNFHTDWVPSYLWKLRKPFVWGPVGHHPRIPDAFLRLYGHRWLWQDRVTWWIKQLSWTLSVGMRRALQRTDYLLAMNSVVPEHLPSRYTRHAIIPSVATHDPGASAPTTAPGFTLLSAGRLVPLKGLDLTIRAFADFMSTRTPEEMSLCKLVLVGSGPEEPALRKLVNDYHLEDHVQFIPWMPRHELMALYRDAHAFLFPSHEGAGMVVAEALSFGLPVICLDNCGPGEFVTPACGLVASAHHPETTIHELAAHLQTLYHNPALRQQMSHAARARFESHFDWNRRGEQLNQIYQSI